MRLSEIIDNITGVNPDLESALLQVKVIARRSGSTDILKWIDAEVSGYEANQLLPPYRIINTVPMGCLMNSAWRQDSAQLPIFALPNGIKESLTTSYIRMSVSALKTAISEQGELIEPIPPEMCSLISKNLANGFQVVEAHKPITNMNLADIYSLACPPPDGHIDQVGFHHGSYAQSPS